MEGSLYPLHDACREGETAVVQQLIEGGHQVNHSNFDLVQPLHEACFRGHIDCVRLLLLAGANVNGRNIDGATPLCDACSSGHVEVVQLLLENGAVVNPPLLLTSPLHEAVLRDKWDCAQALVDRGANLDKTDCHFGTPLHAAVYKRSLQSAKVLLKAGCNVNPVKVLNTPLHSAARQQDTPMVLLLLEFGASVTLTDNSGLTASGCLPSATSELKQILFYWESNPRSLKHLCRLRIRQFLGSKRLYVISQLTLPKLLLEYLKYSNI